MNANKKHLVRLLLCLILTLVLIGNIKGGELFDVFGQSIPSGGTVVEVNPYYSVEYTILSDGTVVAKGIINAPPEPPEGFESDGQVTTAAPSRSATLLADFPSYDWVFGCSAVSGAMIAGYYDRNGYPNMYAGPTNGGVMPISDTSWPTWNDGDASYVNNPLVASQNGLDGRSTRGSIDDYWIKYGSSANDPYITGGWTQHTWGTAIGDFMKTSQSAYGNSDGSTSFYNYTSSNRKLTCSTMVSQGIADEDGTYGRKLFYEARGYTVSDCYSQRTDNSITGGFSLANFQAEIDAGHPVFLNLEGHSVVGYGYDGSTIYIRDTWDSNPNNLHTMNWGMSYSGLALQSVSIVRLASAPEPELNVTVEQAAGQDDPTNTTPITFLATFSEPINPSTFTFSDVTLSGTAGADTVLISEVAPTDGTTFALTVSGMVGDGTVTVEIPAGGIQSLTGHANNASTSTDNEITYDITSPDVTVEQAIGQADPTSASPINFTATFSEPIDVGSFTTTDVNLGGTAAADTVVITEIAPNDGTTYKLSVSGMNAYGTVVVSLSAGVVQDQAGNVNTIRSSLDNSVLFEIYFNYCPLIIK